MSARCLAILVLLTLPAAFGAQRDIAQTYDVSRSMTFTGVVSKLDWGNSQVLIGFNLPVQEGRAVTWTVEAGTPADLELKGWTRDSLKIGTELKVTANPARGFRVAGAPQAYAIKIELASTAVLRTE